jgi:TatD DNase family protein
MFKSPFINIHSHRKPSLASEICVRNAYLHKPSKILTRYYFSAGLHPWHVAKQDLKTLAHQLEDLTMHPFCVAIGEIGLDHYYPNMPAQIDAFTLQVAFAQAKKLPIIIHEVKSMQGLQKILKNFSEPIILHGYNGHIETWEQLNFNNKTYVSFGKQALHGSKKLIDTIQQIPSNRFFIETDQLNIPISHLYQLISEIRSEPMADLQTQLFQNFNEILPATCSPIAVE